VPNTKLKDKWVVIEAKANLDEFTKTTYKGGPESKVIISKAFESTKKRFQISSPNSWFEKYYQYANRLAFVSFMLDNDIDCTLLNIYFINGWPNKPENVSTVKPWKDQIAEADKYLGINPNAKKHISNIFIDCLK
jgi:hypothetical protein